MTLIRRSAYSKLEQKASKLVIWSVKVSWSLTTTQRTVILRSQSDSAVDLSLREPHALWIWSPLTSHSLTTNCSLLPKTGYGQVQHGSRRSLIWNNEICIVSKFHNLIVCIYGSQTGCIDDGPLLIPGLYWRRLQRLMTLLRSISCSGSVDQESLGSSCRLSHGELVQPSFPLRWCAGRCQWPVSYTHLTLPTKRIV